MALSGHDPSGDVTSLRLRRVLGDDPFRLIADNVGDVVSLFNVDTARLEYVSPSVEEQRGFTQAEALQQSLDEIFTAESTSLLKTAIAERLPRVAAGDPSAAQHMLELQQRCKDGSVITVELRGNVVLDEDGTVRYALAVTRDVTSRVAEQDALRVQRDLAVALGAARDLPQALDKVLEAALTVPGVDAAGVYLVQTDSGDLELVGHVGLPKRFVAASSYYAADSVNARLVAAGEPIHLTAGQLRASGATLEPAAGLRAVSSVPIRHEGAVVAALNVASRSTDALTPAARTAVESLAAQVAGALARLRSEARLQESARHYRSLFMDSPVALWESDHSLVKAYLDTLAASGIDDVVAHVLADPAEYERCLRLIRPVAASTAAVRLCEAADEAELLSRNAETHPPPARGGMRLFWAEMLAGGTSTTCETVTHTLSGRDVDVLETVTVVPGHEATYDRVYVADIDITARKRAEQDAARQAELQRRLTHLATTYIGMPLDDVDRAIAASLEDLGRFVQADRVYVFEYDWTRNTASNTHEWCTEGVEPHMGDLQDVPLDYLTDWERAHRRGEAVYVPDVNALPPGPLRDIIEPQGIRSLLAVPMMADGVPLGFVGFDSVRERRVYLEEERRLISVFGAMLGGVRQRMRAEQEVKQSERRLHSVIQGTRAGTWEWNVQTGETVFNERWAEIVGCTLDDLAPVSIETWARLAHPDDLEASDAQLRQVFAREREYYDVECRMRHRDGRWVWVHDRGSVTEWSEDGKPLRMAGTHVDVTEARAARDALRDSAARLRDLALTTADWLWEVDAQGAYTSCSDRIRDVLGYEPAEVVGKTPLDFMTPDEAERLAPVVAGMIERREGCADLLNRNLHRDGHEVVLLTSCVPVLAEDGTLAGFRGVDKDVTAEHHAREALQESEARYKAVAESAADAIITADLDGTIIGWNAAAERIFGYPTEEALGRPVAMLMPETYREGHPASMRRPQESGDPRLAGRVVELTGLRRDGTEFPVELSVSVWTVGGKHYATTIGRDVTERRFAERALAESESQFRLLAENASDVVFRADNDGVTAWVSPSITAVTGWLPGEVEGRPISELVHPDDLRTLRAGQQLLLQGKPATYEFRFLTASGGYRWVSVSVKPIAGEDGTVAGRAGGLRDIQAEVEGREALAASEERYRRVFDVEPDGLLLLDRATLRVVDANEAAVRMYGYSRDELLQQTVARLSAEPEATRRTVETADEAHTEHVPLRSHRRKDGSVFPVEVAAASLTLDDRDLVCMSLRDVTERETRTALAVAASEITARLLGAEETATNADLYNGMLLPLVLATQADRARVYERDPAALPGMPFTQKAFFATPGAHASRDAGTWATRRDFGAAWCGLMGRGEPFLVHEDDADPELAALLGEARLRSLLALPFSAHGETAGCITLEFARHRREWGRDDLLQLGAAAAALSTTLERQRALGDVRARTAELSALLSANRAIVSTLEYDRVLYEVARTAGEVLGSPECVIWEHDSRGDRARFLCLWERDPKAGVAASLEGTSYDITTHVGGLQGLRQGRVVQQSRSDPGLPAADCDDMDAYGEKTWLTVPLVAADELIGVMILIESEAERDFTADERRLAASIGEQAAVALANARLYRRQEERNRWLDALVGAANQVTSQLSMDVLLDNVARLAAEAVVSPLACIYEYDAEREALVTRARYGPEDSGRAEPLGSVFPVEEAPDDRRALFGGEVFVETLSDPALHSKVRGDMEAAGEKTLVNVPFRFAGEPLGMMVLAETAAEREFTADELEYLGALGEQAAVALHNARLYATIEAQAATDGATGLANHRAFYERLEQELARSARYATPVSLLMLDIDDFKAINDVHGHLTGDEALRTIARAIAAEVRTGVDIPARYGGEEFAVILPETPCAPPNDGGPDALFDRPATEAGTQADAAAAIGERIRARVAAEPFVTETGDELRLTVSIGVAGVTHAAQDARSLIACADAAMYAAKAAGKDCVRVFGT